ncbi:MAG: rod shape-determining protein MreC [Candidatus Hinthialibacter antarcticus]|nr:rod shape-determining protein MreC [Candidatus Hinthialibacter antarcticus]
MLFRPEKQNPYRPKKTNWISPRLIAGTLVLIAVVLMLLYAPLPNRTSSSPFARVLLAPLSLLQSARGFAFNTARRISDRFISLEEVETLRGDIQGLQAENTKLRFQLQRHEAYVDALRLPREVEYQTLPVIVLFRDFRLTHDIIINRGGNDGLAVNMPVWTGEGLVGRVRMVTKNFAKVLVLTDPGSSIGVYVEGSPYEGVLRGSNGSTQLVLEDLHMTTQGEEMHSPTPGQEVRTSGTGLVFPRGLLAGYVSSVTSDTGIAVDAALNINTVQSALVFTNTSYRDEVLSLLDSIGDQ